MKHNKLWIGLMVLFAVSFIYSQITIEKTIPLKVELSSIREFVINVGERTVDIHMENGKNFRVERQAFMTFWNNDMTASQRTVIKGFIKQLAVIGAGVDASKVTGDFGE